jgi:hypothetical protein
MTAAQRAECGTRESGNSRELTKRDADDIGDHRAGPIHGIEHIRQHHVHAGRLAIHTFQDVCG